MFNQFYFQFAPGSTLTRTVLFKVTEVVALRGKVKLFHFTLKFSHFLRQRQMTFFPKFISLLCGIDGTSYHAASARKHRTHLAINFGEAADVFLACDIQHHLISISIVVDTKIIDLQWLCFHLPWNLSLLLVPSLKKIH